MEKGLGQNLEEHQHLQDGQRKKTLAKRARSDEGGNRNIQKRVESVKSRKNHSKVRELSALA